MIPTSKTKNQKITLKALGLYYFLKENPNSYRKEIMANVKDKEQAIKIGLEELLDNNLITCKNYKYKIININSPSKREGGDEKVNSDVESIESPSAKIVEKPVEKDKELAHQIKEIYILYTKRNPLLSWNGSGFFASRNTIKNQIEVYGFDETKRVTEWILDNQNKEFIPKINIPYDLNQKWNSVQDAMKRNDVPLSPVIDLECKAGNEELNNYLIHLEKIVLYDDLEAMPEYQNASGEGQLNQETLRTSFRDYLHVEEYTKIRKQYLEKEGIKETTLERDNKIKEILSRVKQNLITEDQATYVFNQLKNKGL